MCLWEESRILPEHGGCQKGSKETTRRVCRHGRAKSFAVTFRPLSISQKLIPPLLVTCAEARDQNCLRRNALVGEELKLASHRERIGRRGDIREEARTLGHIADKLARLLRGGTGGLLFWLRRVRERLGISACSSRLLRCAVSRDGQQSCQQQPRAVRKTKRNGELTFLHDLDTPPCASESLGATVPYFAQFLPGPARPARDSRQRVSLRCPSSTKSVHVLRTKAPRGRAKEQ